MALWRDAALVFKNSERMDSKIGRFPVLPEVQLILIGLVQCMIKTGRLPSEDAFQIFCCLLVQVPVGMQFC